MKKVGDTDSNKVADTMIWNTETGYSITTIGD